MTRPRERQAWYSHGPGEAVDALHNFPERLRRACLGGLTDGVCCKSGLLVKLGEGLECANIGLRRRTRHGHPQHGAAARGPRGAAVSPTQQQVGGRKGKKGKRAFGETDATDCSKQPPAQRCHRLRRPRRHPCGAHPRFSRVRPQGPLARAKGRHFRFTYMGRAAVSASAPGPTAMAIVAASVSTRPTMVLPAVRSNSCRAADSVTRTRNWTRAMRPVVRKPTHFTTRFTWCLQGGFRWDSYRRNQNETIMLAGFS